METDLATTPIGAWHATHGGRMVPFAGWSMPVQYGSIVAEHRATREAVGLFDISHMGRLSISGPGACDLLERILTRRVDDMRPGQIRYSLICNEAGGILDDVLVYRQIDRDGPPYQLVVNAGNRTKIVAWFETQIGSRTAGGEIAKQVSVVDQTKETAMIAIQGPRALESLAGLSDLPLEAMPYYEGQTGQVSGVPAGISRTGYTGEDGWELIVAGDEALPVWEAVHAEVTRVGGLPAGLGCRDTLRLEAAMPLYGHELDESIDPYQAGLGFAVNLEGRTFMGHEALARIQDRPGRSRRVGLALASRRVPRQGYAIYQEKKGVGQATSGTFSPTLNRPIAMAYVDPDVATVGTPLSVDIRGHQEAAEVVPLPFYRRPR
ncbi:MAG: glycine cleavage system aminomethyltransferase GcvT [Pirellulales bacterium]